MDINAKYEPQPNEETSLGLRMAAHHNKILTSLGLIHNSKKNIIKPHRTPLQPDKPSEPDNRHILDKYTSLLQGCASMKALSEGKRLHANMILTGNDQRVNLKTELVNMYAKCEELVDARQMFDKIHEPNVFSWNAMIRCSADHGRCEEALALYNQMLLRGIQPDNFTFPAVLKACTGLSALERGKQIHDDILRNGFESDVFVGNALVAMYAKCGSMKKARQVFDKMTERDLVSWNAMIAGYARSAQCNEALELFCRMLLAGLKPDAVTICSILPACGYLAALQQGREIHDYTLRSGLQMNIFVENALVDMYAKCGSIDDALCVFDQMDMRNVVSWNSLIAGYDQNHRSGEALNLFRQMQFDDVKPNYITIVSVLPACAHLAALQKGKEIHCYIIRSGIDSEVAVGNALVAMYAQCRSVEDARKNFVKMAQRDVFSWTAMIACYVQNGHCEEALNTFSQMQLRGLKPNSVTIASVIPACANPAALQQGKEIHDYIIRYGFESDAIAVNALVSMYAKTGNIENASCVFEKISPRGVVSWNTMIAAYVQNGDGDHALKLFRQMQLAGMKPNSITIASVLPACAKLVSLQQGKEIHNYVLRSGFDIDVFAASAIVDMYAKCGSIKDARLVFDKMSKRDVVLWTTMIVGYAMHGHAEDALTLFSRMQLEGMKPNKITFIGILCACSHAGYVDKGWKFFRLMSNVYSLTPSIEHYACMVDLLGRAGHLDEAHDFIKNMPLQPNASVWGALFSACRIHGSIELGEYVAKHLFQLEHENMGNYVSLSNIYAAAGRWDDADIVRKAMEGKGLKKIPGYSWIHVKNRVC